MIIRQVLPKEKKQFNQVVHHPLQSWEWGDFRQKTGLKVIRLGLFDGQKLKSGYQLTVHSLPKLSQKIIYFPKGPQPTKIMINAKKPFFSKKTPL